MIFHFGKSSVHIDFLFFLNITVMMMLSTKVAAMVLFFSFCHEAGHVLALLIMGGKIKSLRLSAFGMVLTPYENNFSRLKDAAFALSGPMVNLIFAFLLLMFKTPFTDELSAINLMLGLFNLLPVSVLDGGKALFSLFICFFEEYTAVKVMRCVSVATLLTMGSLALLILKANPYNYSLLLIVVYLTIFIINKPMN